MELCLILCYLLAYFNSWIVLIVKKEEREKRPEVGEGFDDAFNNFKYAAAKSTCD